MPHRAGPATFARRAFFLMVMAVLLSACGRTQLSLPRPCSEEGSTKPCADACGVGIETCIDGYWQECIVPNAVRTCQNECGTGEQLCTAGEWQPCSVPIAHRTCRNSCGEGLEWCDDGAWSGACEVEPVWLPCENACGAGTALCADDALGVCEVLPIELYCETVCGAGVERCENGEWFPCDAPQPKPPKLRSIVRDFRDSHPDFENESIRSGLDFGIVEFELGSDGKPVYAGRPTTPSTTGKANFDQWYRDVPGVNLSKEHAIQLLRSTNDPALYVFNGRAFFPIDGQLFGNEGRSHNYHFTLEIETQFRYMGGEVFSFTGDDDLWVFINRRLALDLGGIHASVSGTVDLDDSATLLGIRQGETYSLHLFFAERHTVESNFIVETSIADLPSCD